MSSPNIKSPPKPFAYRPPDPKRATLLFDLDHTLIDTQHQNYRQCVEMPTAASGYKFRFAPPEPTFDRFPAHGYYSTIPNLKDASETQCIVHYRPHIVPFLRFCFKHFNVGLWSTAAPINVHYIALNLLRLVDRHPEDLMCAWARRNVRGSNQTPEEVKYIDVLTNEQLQPPARGVRVSNTHKDLHYVYERFPKLPRKYITLVDNLPTHAVGNSPTGVLWISPFFFLNAHDTVLDVLLRRLQRLWKDRCAAKAVKENTMATTAGTAATQSTTNDAKKAAKPAGKPKPPVKPKPPPPLLVHAGDLRDCLLSVSGTNDDELYPGGYVTDGYNRAYNMSARRLRRYQSVILSVNGRYMRGSVRKVDRSTGMVTVRVMRPATPPPPDFAYTAETPGATPEKGVTTRKNTAVAKGTRRRPKPTFEERVVPVSALIDGSWSVQWAYRT